MRIRQKKYLEFWEKVKPEGERMYDFLERTISYRTFRKVFERSYMKPKEFAKFLDVFGSQIIEFIEEPEKKTGNLGNND